MARLIDSDVLERLGLDELEREDGHVVVRDADADRIYSLNYTDGWVQASQLLFESSELVGTRRLESVAILALRLHARYLGCRFGFDAAEELAAQLDVFPGTPEEQFSDQLQQLAYVAECAFPLFERVLEGGEVSEQDIDDAFSAE